MIERGLHVDHTTIYRCVHHYAPELEKCRRPHLKMTNDSWRVDETYIKVKKVQPNVSSQKRWLRHIAALLASLRLTRTQPIQRLSRS